jgi:membrane protein DedA with SNARE-associated domain
MAYAQASDSRSGCRHQEHRVTPAKLHHLPGVLRDLEPALNEHGYLAILVLVAIEDFGVPLPGETALLLGAVYAGTGRLNILLVALVAFVGAIAGDNIGFAIGHFGGQRLLDRYGRYILLTPERIERVQEFFARHGGKIIVVARFIEGLRQANGIVAGTTAMRWRVFLLYNAIGAALWVAVWCSLGYFSGSHIDTVYEGATRYAIYPAIVVAVLLATYVLMRTRRPRAVAAADHERPAE